MVIKKLHFSFSLFTSYVLFYILLDFDKISSILLSFMVASLSTIPDFDWKIYSFTNKKLVKYDKSKLRKILFLPLYTVYIPLNKIFKHRTTTHSIFIPFLFFILGYTISPIFYIFALSMFLHVLADIFTKSGVPIFYPLYKKSFRIPIINTRKDILLQNLIHYILMITWILIVFLL